jgi:hypothetical protein
MEGSYEARSNRPDIIATGLGSDGLLQKLSGEPVQEYRFRLYIAGSNLNSARAIEIAMGFVMPSGRRIAVLGH